MVLPSFIVALTTLGIVVPPVQGHFSFMRLKADGKWQQPLQYIRNKTSPFDERTYYQSNFLYREWNWPTYYIDYPESVRCGRGNMDHAKETEVLTVKAGDTLEIAQNRWEPREWTEGMFENCPDDRGTCHPEGWRQDFNHEGPLVVHLSKVPEGQDVHTYDGSGDWVKIHSLGLKSTKPPLKWILYDTYPPPHMTFKIPSQTPPGQYLMRMDVIWSGMTDEYYPIGEDGILAEMYPTCAQLNIVSDSQTPLPEGVRIPEIFNPYGPGMTTTRDMAEKRSIDANYTYPGGPLWDGEKLVEDKPIDLP